MGPLMSPTLAMSTGDRPVAGAGVAELPPAGGEGGGTPGAAGTGVDGDPPNWADAGLPAAPVDAGLPGGGATSAAPGGC
jgi:hypothetical protein